MHYSDIVEKGMILDYKNKYTMSDVKKLMAKGYDLSRASWIVVCSAIYHDTAYSLKVMEIRKKLGTDEEILITL